MWGGGCMEGVYENGVYENGVYENGVYEDEVGWANIQCILHTFHPLTYTHIHKVHKNTKTYTKTHPQSPSCRLARIAQASLQPSCSSL